MSLFISFFRVGIVFFCLFSFVCQRRYVLIRLLSLEAVILCLTLSVGLFMGNSFNMDSYYCLVVLTFGACEASVALAVLVLITRSYGRDMLSALRLRKC